METIIAARTGQSRALRIFVVEDHMDTLAMFSLYLESCGHTVVAAKTMTESLALWPLSPHDLLLCDLRLPDGDGWELLGCFVPSPAYAVAVSALGSTKDRARSRAVGFRHHLLKPFKLSELHAVLREVASEAGGGREPTESKAV